MKSQLESFEIKGQWWRPEGAETRKDPQPELVSGSMSIDDGAAFLQSERDKRGGTSYDEACRGPLKFDPESGMKLELLGASEVAFPSQTRVSPFSAKRRVEGHALSSGASSSTQDLS